jgi:hypothetical protein
MPCVGDLLSETADCRRRMAPERIVPSLPSDLRRRGAELRARLSLCSAVSTRVTVERLGDRILRLGSDDLSPIAVGVEHLGRVLEESRQRLIELEDEAGNGTICPYKTAPFCQYKMETTEAIKAARPSLLMSDRGIPSRISSPHREVRELRPTQTSDSPPRLVVTTTRQELRRDRSTASPAWELEFEVGAPNASIATSIDDRRGREVLRLMGQTGKRLLRDEANDGWAKPSSHLSLLSVQPGRVSLREMIPSCPPRGEAHWRGSAAGA